MGKIRELVEGLKPVIIMVLFQLGNVGVVLLYKLAAADGMNLRILIAYRFLFATSFISPIAFLLERNKRPKWTWTLFFQAFLCGLLGGSLSQNLFLESMMLTSMTFATAMFNLVPAVTFILAVLFRLEKAGIRSWAGKAKIMGTIIGISGAMLLTFYKGIEINIWNSHINLLKHYQSSNNLQLGSSNHNQMLLGSSLAVANCFSYALWLIVQTKMSKAYPCPYSSTSLTTLMASIQATMFAVITEKDWSQWKLGWNIRLLTVAYAGVVMAGLMITLVTWCVRVRGPLFVSIFNPLLLVCTAFAGSLFLDEKLHLGSLLGSTLIVCGLYSVLWGKNKEMKK
ncbi:WAT1-related protein At1g68170-like [Euphorbia lathyris]|uniref:WAT1-related protein At1g68170-like n=1 Tax=Euphorbia lathyris TaxID=212925 RepID=UPI0033142B45